MLTARLTCMLRANDVIKQDVGVPTITECHLCSRKVNVYFNYIQFSMMIKTPYTYRNIDKLSFSFNLTPFRVNNKNSTLLIVRFVHSTSKKKMVGQKKFWFTFHHEVLAFFCQWFACVCISVTFKMIVLQKYNLLV